MACMKLSARPLWRLALVLPVLALLAGLWGIQRYQRHEQVEATTAVDMQLLTDDLPPDAFLKDGGRYRKRRHACFVAEADGLHQVPHRMHWQSVDYNALHGGMERWFEPIAPALAGSEAFGQLLQKEVPKWTKVVNDAGIKIE